MAESARGAGLGTALLEWVHEYGRRHGAALVQLTSDKRRTDALRFYERLGFTSTKTQRNYRKPLAGWTP